MASRRLEGWGAYLAPALTRETPWEKGNLWGLEVGRAGQDGEAKWGLETDEEGRSGRRCLRREATEQGEGPGDRGRVSRAYCTACAQPGPWATQAPSKLTPTSGRICPSSCIVLLVQSLNCVPLSATPWAAAHQAPLSFTISQGFLKFISIESVMPSNHLILCHPLLLLSSIFPSIRVMRRWSDFHILEHSVHQTLPGLSKGANTHIPGFGEHAIHRVTQRRVTQWQCLPRALFQGSRQLLPNHTVADLCHPPRQTLDALRASRATEMLLKGWFPPMTTGPPTPAWQPQRLSQLLPQSLLPALDLPIVPFWWGVGMSALHGNTSQMLGHVLSVWRWYFYFSYNSSSTLPTPRNFLLQIIDLPSLLILFL